MSAFSYLIVGAGFAGAVCAERLAAEPWGNANDLWRRIVGN